MDVGAVDILPEDLEAVWKILRASLMPGARVWVFGSRASHTARRFSDLDLAVDLGRPLTRREATILQDEFQESDLPYRVDVVDLHSVYDAFRLGIEQNWVELPKSLGA